MYAARKILLLLTLILTFLTPAGADAETDQAAASPAPPAESGIVGFVRELGGDRPVPGATVRIHTSGSRVRTDDQGAYRLLIEPGTYELTIEADGYRRHTQTVVVSPGRPLQVTSELDPEPIQVDGLTVTVGRPRIQEEISAQTISIREATLIPGAGRDVLRSVTNLPGINVINVFNGYGSGLVIRGSSPEDSAFHLNDQWVPMLYHFGGFESIFEPELVDSVDYFAGGFGAEYLEALGGVVTVNVRDPRTDRFGGYVNLSLLSSSFMVEGPLSEKTSVAISAKRGFLDFYTRLVSSEFEKDLSFTTYPAYYDTMLVCTHTLSARQKLKLIGLGAIDGTELVFEDEAESARISNRVDQETRFFNLIGEWHAGNDTLRSVFSPMVGVADFKLDLGPRSYFNVSSFLVSLSEKMEYELSSHHRIRAGGRLVYNRVSMDSSFFALPKEGEIAYNPFAEEVRDDTAVEDLYPSLYLMDAIRYGRLQVTPGLQAFYDGHNGHYYLDPRLLVRYDLNDAWTLKSATGLYSKRPEEDESYEPWGTQGLRPERSLHAVAGFEYAITDALKLDVQGYYKRFYDLVVRPDSEDPTVYTNQGKGYASGMEILLRQEMTDRFFGWVAYSFSTSRRRDGPGEAERHFDLDIPHNLTAVVSYKRNDFWQFGARFNYASGPPVTDLLNVETLYDVDNGFYVPLYDGPINTDRLPDRHQLDIRIDRYWYFERIVLSTYLDIQNVYFHEQAVGVVYNEDYTQKEHFKTLPILVFLGLKFDF